MKNLSRQKRFCIFCAVSVVHEGGFPWSPGSAIPSGIGLAPSLANFSSVCFLLCSITRLCLKYVTCNPPAPQTISHSSQSASPCPNSSLSFPLPSQSLFPFRSHDLGAPPDPPKSPEKGQTKRTVHTQLAAHSLSNPFPSMPHAPSALSLSLMLSTMPLRSKQAKKSSRARQQCARDCRSGASNAPSGEGVGEAWDGGWEGEGEVVVVVKRPIGDWKGLNGCRGWSGKWRGTGELKRKSGAGQLVGKSEL